MSTKVKMSDLEKVANGHRYSKGVIADLLEEVSAWSENASNWLTKVQEFTDTDFSAIADAIEPLNAAGGVFGDVYEFLTKISALEEDVASVEENLNAFIEACESFKEYGDSWVGNEVERDEIADTKASIEEAADQINTIKNELNQLGVNVEEDV